jgi:hypothetical protein
MKFLKNKKLAMCPKKDHTKLAEGSCLVQQ